MRRMKIRAIVNNTVVSTEVDFPLYDGPAHYRSANYTIETQDYLWHCIEVVIYDAPDEAPKTVSP